MLSEIRHLHNADFPGHVCGNFYEYRGVGIFQDGARYRVDFATGNKWVSSLECAKREIDFALMKQSGRRPATKKQLDYITRLMGETYKSGYGRLTVFTASKLIDAIKVYKNPLFFGERAVDDSGMAFAYENLCSAEISAFGRTFTK